jgi:hypothetical protein
VIACGTTNVGLRTGQEQAALLAGFGTWLNALNGPAQIVISAQRHDLTPYAEAVLDATARLPNEALRAAADDYAAFLLDLDATRDPLRRQVLTVTAALAGAVDPYNPPVPGPRAVPTVPITARRTA